MIRKLAYVTLPALTIVLTMAALTVIGSCRITVVPTDGPGSTPQPSSAARKAA